MFVAARIEVRVSLLFFFSSRRRHTRSLCDWSSDVCSSDLKRLLIGSPLATAQQEQERLTKFKALAVLSSDAISSVAYATEAILITIVAAGSGNLWVILPRSEERRVGKECSSGWSP